MKSVIERYQKARDGDNQLPTSDKEVKVQYNYRIILTNISATSKYPNFNSEDVLQILI